MTDRQKKLGELRDQMIEEECELMPEDQRERFMSIVKKASRDLDAQRKAAVNRN